MPPLCKGRWVGNTDPEGLFNTLQSLSQNRKRFRQLPLHKGAFVILNEVKNLELPQSAALTAPSMREPLSFLSGSEESFSGGRLPPLLAFRMTI